ncbi:YicC/YloC family endoribonuclease [uncultured Alistipes sp.]|uniref:YicC/YloC family endoribonuclease n=1 Tax=uncultured Alistipes sp. TaxID=538949 RepID=UPI00260F2435|nr:YicC/YloC family endoribonuclease [uncultured Alistipes sp.]
MIKSMTGYGKAEAVLEHKKITVEIRSLNSKQLDLSMRVPSLYRQSEYEIRNLVAKRALRGKVDVYISYETIGRAGSVALNREAFGDYLAQLRDIVAGNGLSWNEAMAPAAVAAVLRLPDVVQNETTEIPDEELAALKGAVAEALDRMDAFRVQEGAILIADLLGRIDRIERLKNDILPYEKARTETIRNRIRENIESLGITVDGNRLEQEMIYYLEKLDVTEEKVRLQNHCDYFREVSRSEEGVGRKLGFIAQEMGREINTLGSKANEATMQKMVVGMKDELEKIKEQLLNIL